MKPSLSTRVSAPDYVLVQELEGEAVLLNLEGERYYSLDDVGTRMWNVLTTAPSIGAAHGALLDEYQVDSERLEQDLLELVERLASDGLVELHDAQG
jgi:coenzyme PQQ synthesis protein D (PqqD)